MLAPVAREEKAVEALDAGEDLSLVVWGREVPKRDCALDCFVARRREMRLRRSRGQGVIVWGGGFEGAISWRCAPYMPTIWMVFVHANWGVCAWWS